MSCVSWHVFHVFHVMYFMSCRVMCLMCHVMCHVMYFMCHVMCFMCHVFHVMSVMCFMSCVSFHMFHVSCVSGSYAHSHKWSVRRILFSWNSFCYNFKTDIASVSNRCSILCFLSSSILSSIVHPDFIYKYNPINPSKISFSCVFFKVDCCILNLWPKLNNNFYAFLQ